MNTTVSSASKNTIDKIMLVAWCAYMFLNVVANFLTNLSGILVLSVTWAFAIYFNFIYGKKEREVKYDWIALAVFLVVFILIIQFFRARSAAEIYYSMGVPFALNVWHLISFVPTILTCTGIIARSDENKKMWLKTALVVCLVIVSLVSIPILIANPNAAKATATGRGTYYPFFTSYGMSYFMPFCIAAIIANLKNTKYKIIYIAAIALMTICLFLSSFLISLVALIVCLLCYLMFQVKNKFIRYTGMIAFLGFIVYMLFSGEIVDMLYELAEVITIENIATRLRQIADTMVTGDTGDATRRFELYNDMLMTGLKHPIIGNIIWEPAVDLSGHSTVLDMWAGCGMIALIPFALFFVSAYKVSNGLSEQQHHKALSLSVFITFMFIAIFNPVFSAKELAAAAIIVPFAFLEETGQQVKKEKFQSKYVKRKKLKPVGYYRYKSYKER